MGNLEITDWLLAVTFLVLGAVSGLLGIIASQQQGTPLWQNGALFAAVLWLGVGGMFGLAAFGMGQQTKWRWFAQVAPAAFYMVGVLIVICLLGHDRIDVVVGQDYVNFTADYLRQKGILDWCDFLLSSVR
ncbi:MAG: hypothetical protein HY689_10905 [Chloroflexi bacterium]|nr:hypothetical protein [Chloroflexota bacterium]